MRQAILRHRYASVWYVSDVVISTAVFRNASILLFSVLIKELPQIENVSTSHYQI